MKTISFFAAMLMVLFTGCLVEDREEIKYRTVTEQYFAGDHAIHRMMPTNTEKASMGGFFFLGTGVVSGSEKSEPSVTFSWRPNGQEAFLITTLPLSKIRPQFSDSVASPTVTFHIIDLQEMTKWTKYDCWKAVSGQSTRGPEYVLDNYLAYALITVRPEDWPVKIQMPL